MEALTLMNPAEQLRTGTTLKGQKGTSYQILKHLGGGGFGQTYLAVANSPQDRGQCVIKQLKLGPNIPLSLEDARERFQREAGVLEKLGHHPQIPSLWDNFEQNNGFYFVQDFIDGQELSKEIETGKPWSEGAVIGLLWDVLTVLKLIQSLEPPVSHRDINPNNLIRRKSDRKIVVIDFGAFKEIKATLEGKQSEITICIGTPGYAPPEQMAGKPRTNSDIYALGMVALYAATGRPPRQFDYDTQTGKLHFPPLPFSPDLSKILEKMVRAHYQERYQSATEVLQDLSPLHSIGSKL
ncbi:serine/threonine-protein kinase [Oscillatoria acuminata]|uniref:non-specific serine/threonine protein kinase n=1 Tax=Oscillatoria acuminata PCC 6304 TaxID=56110 RepID=K9TLL3_9CYAN|nr:serine/threonine-protein kinase [Oscillatoria acuminata]AFY83420.1 protein kinase family protein [Oscillatoria acuminata PCC 6304]